MEPAAEAMAAALAVQRRLCPLRDQGTAGTVEPQCYDADVDAPRSAPANDRDGRGNRNDRGNRGNAQSVALLSARLSDPDKSVAAAAAQALGKRATPEALAEIVGWSTAKAIAAWIEANGVSDLDPTDPSDRVEHSPLPPEDATSELPLPDSLS